MDLAIFDEQYTPYIFRYGVLKFIPIEAVAAVIECKSKKFPLDGLENWCNSINQLKTSLNSIVRIATEVVVTKEASDKVSQSATRPLRILCHSNESTSEEICKKFDFVLNIKGKKLSLWMDEDKKISRWYGELNHADLGEEDLREKIDHSYFKKPRYPEQKDPEQEKEDPTLGEYIVKNNFGDEEVNTILTLTFTFNQLLMLINNPIPFPHRAYVDCFNRIEGISENNDQTDSSN